MKLSVPHVNQKMVDNFSDNYLSYPVIGEETTRYYLCCKSCGSEYELNVKLKSISIELEIDETKLDKQ